MNRTSYVTHALAFVAAATLYIGQALAADGLPDKTDDGLERIPAKKVQALYWQPGASLEAYKRVAILEPFVAFRKDWQADQNRDRRGVQQQVTSQDMDRIKKALAAEFLAVFTKELQDKGGYQVVDSAGEDVLVLRPAIVNLDVAAPDLRTSVRTFRFCRVGRLDDAVYGTLRFDDELIDSARHRLSGRNQYRAIPSL